jgi:hypothetical protein
MIRITALIIAFVTSMAVADSARAQASVQGTVVDD